MRSRFSLGVNVRKTLRLACLASAIVITSACSPTYRNYGYIPPQEDLDALTGLKQVIEQEIQQATTLLAQGEKQLAGLMTTKQELSMTPGTVSEIQQQLLTVQQALKQVQHKQGRSRVKPRAITDGGA